LYLTIILTVLILDKNNKKNAFAGSALIYVGYLTIVKLSVVLKFLLGITVHIYDGIKRLKCGLGNFDHSLCGNGD